MAEIDLHQLEDAGLVSISPQIIRFMKRKYLIYVTKKQNEKNMSCISRANFRGFITNIFKRDNNLLQQQKV